MYFRRNQELEPFNAHWSDGKLEKDTMRKARRTHRTQIAAMSPDEVKTKYLAGMVSSVKFV